MAYVAGALVLTASDAPLLARVRGGVRKRHPEIEIDDVVERVTSGADRGGWRLPRELGRQLVRGAEDRTVCPALTAPRSQPAQQLRDYQRRAIDAWEQAGRVGVIVAPCGAGKTTMGVAAIRGAGTRALVLVHTRDLAEQWLDRLEADLGRRAVAQVEGLGRLPASTRVAVGLVQGLSGYARAQLERWGAQLGLVVLDEAHHAPARTWSQVVGALPARYRLGLTATPEREDGREALLHAHFGPTVHEVSLRTLEAQGATLRPTIRYVETRWQPRGRGTADEQLVDDPRRNGLIVDLVADQVDEGRTVLVLVRRVEHAEILADELEDEVGRAELVVGDMPVEERLEALDEVRRGRSRVLVATSLADEGLDLPVLDTVVFGAPSSALGRVQQRAGRVLRPEPGKTALVVDLVDAHPEALQAARRRDDLYRRLGWPRERVPRALSAGAR